MDMERRAKEINSIMTADTGYGLKTAKVTLESDTVLNGAFIIPKELESAPLDYINVGERSPLGAGTYDLVLYKGKGLIFAEGVEVSGYAEEIEDDIYLVTGNCTITIPDDDDNNLG